MNPTAHRYKTLGALRAELAVRLGERMQGDTLQNHRALLDSFLHEAHETVYAQLDDAVAHKTAQLTTSPGEMLYDWHNTAEDQEIDPLRVHEVGLQRETVYLRLIHGISARQRAQPIPRRCPGHYDSFNGQLLLWPMPDARYPVSITYTASMPRFTQDADRPGVPDRLVFLYALATAKAHYREPDAAVAGKAFETLLSAWQNRQPGERRYFVQRAPAETTLPQVVRTEQGYALPGGMR